MNYAKLATPRLHGALARERLFALLDSMRDKHAVLWVAAPPGAGKTTLAASYLAHAQAQARWCQLDQGDADPATLFYFLAELIKDTGPALPWSNQGSPSERSRFERLFFRDFYARLPSGTIVVFDNVHEFDWGNAGNLMEVAFSEVPQGITVLALSRDAPPARLARMELSGHLATIGWNEMRLDADETRALSQQDGGTSGDWLDMVDGWVAGLVMLLNLRKRAGTDAVPLLEGRAAVFHYFAGEIFERMSAQARHQLMLLSCLPGMSADDAGMLTGSQDAARLLDSLYRDRLFVERRGTTRFTYHFHALFREFLQHEATLRLEAGERTALLARAATILDTQGRIDEAAQLFQDAGAHQPLATLLLNHAHAMLDAGRGQTWREWMSSLPPDLIEQQPWLVYWHGVSLNPVTPLRARQILGRAEQAFGAAGDWQARLLAIAAIIDTYDLEWQDFRTLPHWIAELAAGLSAPGATFTLDYELKLQARLTLALLMVSPESSALASAAERALAILPQVDKPVEQLAAGAILLRYFEGVEKSDTVHSLVQSLNRLADDPAISPFHRVKWYSRVALWYNRDGNFQEAQQITGSAKRIVASFDLDPLQFQFLEIHHLLGSGDLDAARTLLAHLWQQALPKRAPDLIELHALEAAWRARAGDTGAAITAALEAIRISADECLPAAERARFEGFVGACYAMQGDFANADHWLAEACSHAFGYETVLAREARALVAAYALSVAGQHDAAATLLRATLAGHRQRQATTMFLMLPQLASQVLALALRHGIESEHACAIIVRQHLAAPQRHAPGWPWPVAVRTFGKFELYLDGKLVTASGKAQQRPLLLLKALAAAGEAGKNLQSLAAQLWPNADNARSALSVTVHRLRKLLGNDELIAVNAGKAQLVGTSSWSDVSALGQVCDQIDSLDHDAASAEVHLLNEQLLGLYRGSFCDGEDHNWMLPIRERCCNRFLAAVAKLGARLEALGEWTAAIALYQRALAAEPLAETTYRGLMRCSHAQNDAAAACSAYRRCRDTLSIVLGRLPSAETEKLAITLGLK